MSPELVTPHHGGVTRCHLPSCWQVIKQLLLLTPLVRLGLLKHQNHATDPTEKGDQPLRGVRSLRYPTHPGVLSQAVGVWVAETQSIATAAAAGGGGSSRIGNGRAKWSSSSSSSSSRGDCFSLVGEIMAPQAERDGNYFSSPVVLVADGGTPSAATATAFRSGSSSSNGGSGSSSSSSSGTSSSNRHLVYVAVIHHVNVTNQCRTAVILGGAARAYQGPSTEVNPKQPHQPQHKQQQQGLGGGVGAAGSLAGTQEVREFKYARLTAVEIYTSKDGGKSFKRQVVSVQTRICCALSLSTSLFL